MEELVKEVSPFRRFSREEWAALRADTPMTLTQKDLDELRGLNDRIDLNEVETIYLPLSRLLNLYVAATQGLFRATNNFLHVSERKVPYVIGMAGSVAVGKSTTARILQRLLARWPKHPKVDLVTTDGFLLPNAILDREGLMTRKGFPESYDLPAILRFLSDIKAGKRNVTAPLYSHLTYDVLKDERAVIDQPDILIVEGRPAVRRAMAAAFRTPPTSLISRSTSTPTLPISRPGTSSASSRCATAPSAIPSPTSTAMRRSPTRNRARRRPASGTPSTW